MSSRKLPQLISLGLAAWGLACSATAADAGGRCAVGPAQIQAMVQSDQAFDQDENLNLWVQASDCDWQPVAAGADGQAISLFLDVARDNGLGGGLRTFARNGNFRLYVEGMNAMDLGAANNYLDKTPFVGTWRELSRGGSADGSLLFAVGELALPRGRLFQYAQVWQFDPKVANWGMRLLLLHPLANNK